MVVSHFQMGAIVPSGDAANRCTGSSKIECLPLSKGRKMLTTCSETFPKIPKDWTQIKVYKDKNCKGSIASIVAFKSKGDKKSDGVHIPRTEACVAAMDGTPQSQLHVCEGSKVCRCRFSIGVDCFFLRLLFQFLLSNFPAPNCDGFFIKRELFRSRCNPMKQFKGFYFENPCSESSQKQVETKETVGKIFAAEKFDSDEWNRDLQEILEMGLTHFL